MRRAAAVIELPGVPGRRAARRANADPGSRGGRERLFELPLADLKKEDDGLFVSGLSVGGWRCGGF